tara:strand:+ start:63242 stop:66535 length:3294 start_codon:yes stop_codon:yes gene_type:complete
MSVANSTPTLLGLYINSFEKGSNTDPYTQLLGTDGYGNYSLGNKIEDLCNYTAQYGYNYGLFYGLANSAFTSSVTSENFLSGTGVGADILNTVLPRFHNDGGIVNRAAILDVAQPQMNSVGVLYSDSDGISQIKKIINWNQSVSYDPEKAFNWINIETEFWNFPYNEALLKSTGVQLGNAVVGGFNKGRLTAQTAGTINFLTEAIGVNDFISANGQWRQVVSVTANTLTLDRPFTTTGVASSWRHLTFADANSTVDYDTFLYRMQKACQYIAAYGSGELIDIYVGFPTYDFKATASSQQRQLARLYQAGVNKILLTAYQRFPTFDYIDGNYASGATYVGTFTAGSNVVTNTTVWGVVGGIGLSGAFIPAGAKLGTLGVNSLTMVDSANNPVNATSSGVKDFRVDRGLPTGGYKRVSNDIISDSLVRNIGVIFSMESTTNNNSSCPTHNTDNNFSGYIMEGRSITPHSSSTDFKATDTGGNTTICVCCNTTTMSPPPPTYNALSLDELWQYVAEVPPSGGICPACYPTQTNSTFNEYITAGGTRGTNLNSYINFDTMIVFDQEFMRQLNITPVIAFTLNTTKSDITCNGLTDGMATVDITGGVQPYSFQWEFYDVGTATWTTYSGTGATTDQITGLPTGDYRCIVTDNAATSITSNSITITEPAIIDFVVTAVDGDCAGNAGSITISNITGGIAPYLYSIVQDPLPPVWTGNTSATVSAGLYNVAVLSGNPSAGCFVVKGAFISAGSSFTISFTHTEPTCYGGFGTVTITPSTPGTYTYNLNIPGSIYQSNTTGIFTNIPDGEYTAQAFNSLGCGSNVIDPIKVTQPSIVNLSAVSNNPTCYLGTNGDITLTATGGTGSSYDYYLMFPSGTTITNTNGIFTGLAPMTYEYFATDINGCYSNIGNITISSPSQISPIYEVIQIPQGLAIGGSITLSYISGGLNPYSYLWNTGDTTSSITNLIAGTYTVTITDDNDCQVIQSFTIKTECTNLSYDEYKVQIYKAQCCAGKLSKKYIKFMQQGREDLAFPVMQDITALTLIINAIKCDDNPGNESCFSCDEMITLLENIKNICSCDCCEDQNSDQVTVTFNSDTNQLDIIE